MATVNDGLVSLPWKTCFIKDAMYIMKYEFGMTSYRIMISDLVHLYSEEIGCEDITSRCQNLNPKIEFEISSILEELQNIVGKWNDDSKNECSNVAVVMKDSSILKLRVESLLYDVPFIWEFTFNVESSFAYFSHVMEPILGITCELQRRNVELMNIIKKKDDEISDYKRNGAKPSFKYLETPLFADKDFFENMKNTESIIQSLKEPIKKIFEDPLYNFVSFTIANLRNQSKETECDENLPKKQKISELQDDGQRPDGVKKENEVHNNTSENLQPQIKRKPKKKQLVL